jgi:hypothetical protein
MDAEYSDGIAILLLNRPRVQRAQREGAMALRAALMTRIWMSRGLHRSDRSGNGLLLWRRSDRDRGCPPRRRPQDAVALCRLIADTFRTAEEIVTSVIARTATRPRVLLTD